jgi:hypothetical protein
MSGSGGAAGAVGALNPLLLIGTVLSALPAIGTAVEMNQAKQQAKGAANAAQDQQNQVYKALADQKKADAANLNLQQTQGGASQAAALAAIRASMSANSGAGGTILTGPQGAMAAPTQTKTLLGA